MHTTSTIDMYLNFCKCHGAAYGPPRRAGYSVRCARGCSGSCSNTRLLLKAMKTPSFCALSLSCSIMHRAAAWSARPSPPHAHRTPSCHSPTVWASGRRVPRHSCRTRAPEPLVAFAAAGTSTPSKEEAVGYEVDESGRCTEVEALPPLKNRYYALRHGQSVANM